MPTPGVPVTVSFPNATAGDPIDITNDQPGVASATTPLSADSSGEATYTPQGIVAGIAHFRATHRPTGVIAFPDHTVTVQTTPGSPSDIATVVAALGGDSNVPAFFDFLDESHVALQGGAGSGVSTIHDARGATGFAPDLAFDTGTVFRAVIDPAGGLRIPSATAGVNSSLYQSAASPAFALDGSITIVRVDVWPAGMTAGSTEGLNSIIADSLSTLGRYAQTKQRGIGSAGGTFEPWGRAAPYSTGSQLDLPTGANPRLWYMSFGAGGVGTILRFPTAYTDNPSTASVLQAAGNNVLGLYMDSTQAAASPRPRCLCWFMVREAPLTSAHDTAIRDFVAARYSAVLY